MKLNEWQLLALVVGAFTAVIALDVLLQYRNNAEWTANFPQLPRAIFAQKNAATLQSEEMSVPAVRYAPTMEEPVEESHED